MFRQELRNHQLLALAVLSSQVRNTVLSSQVRNTAGEQTAVVWQSWQDWKVDWKVDDEAADVQKSWQSLAEG